MLGKSSQNILPNGGEKMVICHGKRYLKKNTLTTSKSLEHNYGSKFSRAFPFFCFVFRAYVFEVIAKKKKTPPRLLHLLDSSRI